MHVVPRIMWLPEAFLDPQNAPKSFSAGASPQTTLGELTALPQKLPLATHCGSLQRSPRAPSWIQGVLLLRLLLLRGGEWRGVEGKGRERREEEGEGRGCLVLKLPLATPLVTSGLNMSENAQF